MTRTASHIGQGEKLLVKCQTSDHWPVILVGSAPELGSWQPEHGIPMQPSDGGPNRTEWSASAHLPLGQTIEFKFVKKTDHGIIWENGINRRYTVIPGHHTLSDMFRQ